MEPTRISRPADIESASMAIIRRELAEQGISLDPEQEPVILRAIHTTADFDFARTLTFTPGAVSRGVSALQGGADIVTDTNMAKAGISQGAIGRFRGEVYCFMADPRVSEEAKRRDTTRAVVSMDLAAREHPNAILAVGNAPTALLELCELISGGLRPPLVIGVPVGFVNVAESKERLLEVCRQYDVPAIVARGRKGGSTVATAICNALLYTAAGLLDPGSRN